MKSELSKAMAAANGACAKWIIEKARSVPHPWRIEMYEIEAREALGQLMIQIQDTLSVPPTQNP